MKKLLIMLVLFLFLTAIVQAAGELDPLFGNGGKVTTDFNGVTEDCTAVLIQPDGKIIAAATNFVPQEFVLVRYNPNGSLDPTFGVGGKVSTDFGQNESLGDIKLQTDGKIIVGGVARLTSTDPMVIALARYNPNGTLDPTFGTGGKVTAGLPNYNFTWPLVAVAIQSDGKIVVSGAANDTSDGFTDSFVARFNPNGSLDPTFSGGIVTFDLSAGASEFLNDVVIQTDNRIVATGVVPGAGGQDTFDFYTVRLNPDGGLDPTFGSGGRVITNFADGNDFAREVLIQPDDKIVVAGGGSSSVNQIDFAIVRYNPDGSFDPTFGNGGIVTTDFSGATDTAFAISLQPDGKIIAVGSAAGNNDFALARYNPNGSLDPTFGVGGEVLTDFIGLQDIAKDAVIQSDGKIVLAGSSDQGGSNFDFALARYNGDIVLPPTCGLYSDDFEDGVLAPDWIYVKPTWNEVGGNLEGTPPHGKAEAIATPAFVGCGTGNCTIQTTIQTAGGISNKIFFFGWYQDKDNLVEVLMKEEQDKWVIKQISNGAIVAKTKASATILPNTFYDVRVAFDGAQFTLTVDGVDLVSMNAGATPSGTVGFRVKKTTGRFGNICAN